MLKCHLKWTLCIAAVTESTIMIKNIKQKISRNIYHIFHTDFWHACHINKNPQISILFVLPKQNLFEHLFLFIRQWKSPCTTKKFKWFERNISFYLQFSQVFRPYQTKKKYTQQFQCKKKFLKKKKKTFSNEAIKKINYTKL